MSQRWVAGPLSFAARAAPLHLGRALAACVATAAAVIALAMLVHPAQVCHVATAWASWCTAAGNEGNDTSARWAYRQRLRQAVLSDAFLAAAIRRASAQTGGVPEDWPSPAVVREWIDVAVQPSAAEDRLEVRFTCRAGDATRACRLAGALAEETIAWAAAELSQTRLATRHAAQAAVEQARLRYRQVQTRMESFLDDFFAGHPAVKGGPVELLARGRHRPGSPAPVETGEKAAASSPAPAHQQTGEGRSAAPQTAPRPTRSAENPKWVRLNNELEGLRAELAVMLIERTTAHPGVQDLQRRIRELEVHLETVPQFLPAAAESQNAADAEARGNDVARLSDSQVSLSPHTEEAASGRGVPAESARHLEAAETYLKYAETYRKYKEEWLAAERELAAAEARERGLWAHGADTARVLPPAVARVPGTAVAEGRPRDWSHLATLALAAGLTVAFGTVLLSAGFEMDTPLASADQARKCLPAPVIGTVRVASENPGAPSPGTLGFRAGLMAAGSLVIAGCMVLVAIAL